MATNSVSATSTKLLVGLADDGNQSAWQTLDARMRPVIKAAAERLGVGSEGADEVAQQTLVKVYGSFRDGKFTGGKGKLRHWIMAIARNTAFDLLRHRQGSPQAGSVADDLPDEQRVTAILAEEWKRSTLQRAFELLRSSSRLDARTIRAFELIVLHGVPVSEVAIECEMTDEQVYVAKSRVRARFIELYEQLSEPDEGIA